jgi:hypothetical protein
MLRPASTFSSLAGVAAPPGRWMLLRRPLAVSALLGCVVSLIASGVLTLRLIVPAIVVWSYVPIVLILALGAVTWPRRQTVPFSRAVDVFFTGYGPWAILLIALASALSFLPPEIGWERARLWLGGIGLVVIWSAYLDYWFFRAVYRATPLAAVRDLLLVRLISWTLIFWIFAIPDSTPLGVFGGVIAAVKELTR